MSIIRTVLGDIHPADLGVCYGHEHVLARPPETVTDPDLTMDSESAAIKELTWFREAGGQALVEMSTSDYGRDVVGLRRVSEKTGVHIIAATGFQKERMFNEIIRSMSVQEMTDLIIREVEVGVDQTGIRAGVIKAGTSENQITPTEDKVIRAAAQAHLATGAPISTHTQAGTMGLEQVELFTSLGVNPGHITIGHLDRNLDWDYHLKLAQTGIFLGYDHIGKTKYDPDSKRIDFILRLVAKGHGQQIVLGGDYARKSYRPSYGTGGGPGLTYILWRFIPWLRSKGLDEFTIEDLLVQNPTRSLTMATVTDGDKK